MSAIDRSLFRSPIFDPNVLIHKIVPFIPPRETGVFLNTIAANPHLVKTEYSPDLKRIYRDVTLEQLKNNTPGAALRLAVKDRNYLLLKQLLKSDAAFVRGALDERFGGYTFAGAFHEFAKEGDTEGMNMILHSARRKDLRKFEMTFKQAHPRAALYMLDPANHIDLNPEIIGDHLVRIGKKDLFHAYPPPPLPEEKKQVMEAILTSPIMADWIRKNFFLIAYTASQNAFELIERNIDLFDPSLEIIDGHPWNEYGGLSSMILRNACRYDCFEIIRKMIDVLDLDSLKYSRGWGWIYPLKTELLQECSAKCAQAGHTELAHQINTAIAQRNQLCNKIDFAVRATIVPYMIFKR